MKNVLMKNHVMNSKNAGENAIIWLDGFSLSYNYQFSTSITEYAEQYNKTYINKDYSNKIFKPFELIPFDYDGVKFNMISCPAGGVVNIANWGLQEIKEPFMLGETEVTQELFETVMGFNYSIFKDDNKNPVEMVSWFDCLEFCNRLSDYFGFEHSYVLEDRKLSYTSIDYGLDIIRKYPFTIVDATYSFNKWANGFRLPKEWEWQIAAMAGTNNQYAGASDVESLKRVAWFDANSDKKTHPVAQKLPNEWGFYDMTGNLSELCENLYNPKDNNNASLVTRGGCFINFPNILALTDRGSGSKDNPTKYTGLRVSRSI